MRIFADVTLFVSPKMLDKNWPGSWALFPLWAIEIAIGSTI